MFKYFKVKNHKGVKTVKLDDLGHINILFGKNNSGKTSIMEGINKESCIAIGKKLDNAKSLISFFEQGAGKYFDNVAKKATKAFSRYIDSLCEQNIIWYYGEEEEIIAQCTKDLSKSRELQHLGRMYDMKSILDNWFQKIESSFRPILVPPKRKLEARVEVNLNQKVESFGSGIANHLFYLKNQNPSTYEHEIYKQIFYAFSEISDYEFDIIPDLDNHIQIVFKRLNEDDWISAEHSGLGLADLLILITFAVGTSHSVICLEEPESHLHPEMQKRLLTFLKSIENKQFIISTHSNIFLNPSLVDKIFHIQYKDGEVVSTDETESANILYNLGYSISDHLIADAIILVEHSSVIPILSTVLTWIGMDKRFNINYFPLVGDVRAYLDLSIFSQRQNVLALTYTRSDTEVATTRFYRNCEKMNIQVFRLSRASIENYFTLDSLKEVFDKEIPEEIEDIEPHISLDAQIGFSLKHKSIKTHNNQIIQAMSVEDLEDTDLLLFCEKIQKRLKKMDLLKLPLPEHESELKILRLEA